MELDQKCRYTDEPKPKFTDQEPRNIDQPDPKFTDQDLLLVNVPTENRFSAPQEPDSRHREVPSQKINPPKTNQNESAIINANRHAMFLCDSNGKFLDTKRMFPPNQEVHYSWCPKIENARATLHNDINDSPQLLLIQTGTNDLSITTPIVEFIAQLSTLITEAATKFPTRKIIYSTLLPRTDLPIPIITRINEQLITECSRLPNVHLINHANLFAEGIDLLHDTKHIKRRHIDLFAANLIDAIRGRARQTRYNPKVVNHVNRSPRRQVRSAPKNKYSSYSQALQSTPPGDYQIPNSQPRQQSKQPALSGSHHYQTQLLDQPPLPPPPPRQCSNTPQT